MSKSTLAGIEVLVVPEADDVDFAPVILGREVKLNDKDAKRIAKTAAKIRRVLSDDSQLAIVSSGQETGVDTALALLSDKWVRSHALMKGRIATASSLRVNPYNRDLSRAAALAAELTSCANMVTRESDSPGRLGMVLISPPEFIEEIPASLGYQYTRAADSTPLAVNRFTAGV